jgi:hypothetical protein
MSMEIGTNSTALVGIVKATLKRGIASGFTASDPVCFSTEIIQLAGIFFACTTYQP